MRTKQEQKEVKSALTEAYQKREQEQKEQGKEYSTVLFRLAKDEDIPEGLLTAVKAYAGQQGYSFDKDLSALKQLLEWERNSPNWNQESEKLMKQAGEIGNQIQQVRIETAEQVRLLQVKQQEIYSEALRIGSIGTNSNTIKKNHSHLFRN
jgi:hypothetical protein